VFDVLRNVGSPSQASSNTGVLNQAMKRVRTSETVLRTALVSDEGKKTTIEDAFIKRRITERSKVCRLRAY
jgi:hypothetical protein